MTLTQSQIVKLFDSYRDFGDHADDLLIDVANFIAFAATDTTPSDPGRVLYGMISALGSEHGCLGEEGSEDVTIAIVETVKKLVRLADTKEKVATIKKANAQAQRRFKRVRGRSRKGAAA